MGFGLGNKSKSVFDNRNKNNRDETYSLKIPNNPDPNNYVIKRHMCCYSLNGFFTIVEINYPDCENFEGNKILVFQNVTIEQLKEQKVIDPHFSSNDKYFSPVARFVPTQEGWENADIFCNAYFNLSLKDFMDWKYRRDQWEEKFDKKT